MSKKYHLRIFFPTIETCRAPDLSGCFSSKSLFCAVLLYRWFLLHGFPPFLNDSAVYHEADRVGKAFHCPVQRRLQTTSNWRVRYLLCNMGDSYREMGDYSGAIGPYNVAMRLAPDLADAHVKLGKTYLKQDRTQKAMNSFRRAIDIDPRLKGPVGSHILETLGGKR
jgi:tetratricopeptide (TPR) repeat protein